MPAKPPTAERARVVAGLAQYLVGSSNAEAIALCTEAIEVAHATGAVEIEANASVTRAAGLCAVGSIEQALEDATRGFELASRVSGSVEIPRSLRYISEINDFAERHELAVEAASRAFDEADRLGLARSEGISDLSLLAGALIDSGRWDEAEQVLGRMERIGVTGWRANHFHLLLAHLQMTRGDLDAAALHVAALDRLAESDVEGEYVAPTIAVRARLAVRQGQPGRVRALVDSALGALGQRDQYAIELAWIHYWAIRAEADMAYRARRRRRESEVQDAVDRGARHVTQVDSLAVSLPSGHWMRHHVDRLQSMAHAEIARIGGRDAASDWLTGADEWARTRPMNELEAYAAGARVPGSWKRERQALGRRHVAADPRPRDRDCVEGPAVANGCRTGGGARSPLPDGYQGRPGSNERRLRPDAA